MTRERSVTLFVTVPTYVPTSLFYLFSVATKLLCVVYAVQNVPFSHCAVVLAGES